MRVMIAVIPVAAALMLGACAPTASGNRYENEYQKLSEDCRARGGILTTTGQQSGRPQLDNVCKISGEPSDRLRPRSDQG